MPGYALQPIAVPITAVAQCSVASSSEFGRGLPGAYERLGPDTAAMAGAAGAAKFCHLGAPCRDQAVAEHECSGNLALSEMVVFSEPATRTLLRFQRSLAIKWLDVG